MNAGIAIAPSNTVANGDLQSTAAAPSSVASSQPVSGGIETLWEARQRRKDLFFDEASSPAAKRLFALLEMMHHAKLSIDQHVSLHNCVFSAAAMLGGDCNINDELMKKLNLANLGKEDLRITDFEQWAICEDLSVQRDPKRGVAAVRGQDAARQRARALAYLSARPDPNPAGAYEEPNTRNEIPAGSSAEAASSSHSARRDDVSLLSIACSVVKDSESVSLDMILAIFDNQEDRDQVVANLEGGKKELYLLQQIARRRAALARG